MSALGGVSDLMGSPQYLRNTLEAIPESHPQAGGPRLTRCTWMGCFGPAGVPRAWGVLLAAAGLLSAFPFTPWGLYKVQSMDPAWASCTQSCQGSLLRKQEGQE